jgi:hypothetical protein
VKRLCTFLLSLLTPSTNSSDVMNHEEHWSGESEKKKENRDMMREGSGLSSDTPAMCNWKTLRLHKEVRNQTRC